MIVFYAPLWYQSCCFMYFLCFPLAEEKTGLQCLEIYLPPPILHDCLFNLFINQVSPKLSGWVISSELKFCLDIPIVSLIIAIKELSTIFLGGYTYKYFGLLWKEIVPPNHQ